MHRITILRPRTLLTLTVGIIALLGGFVLAQAPGVRAAMNSLSLLAVPVIPATFNYQGFLRETDGSLTKGTFIITAKIYDTPTGGTWLFGETLDNVNVRDGLFNIVLGDSPGNPLGTTFDGAPRYIGITLNNGEEILPRERIHGVPWALHATHAANASRAEIADVAIGAGQATNATFATFSSTATEADNLNGVNVQLYSANGMGGVDASQELTQWKNNLGGTACFLSETQTLADKYAYCSIDQDNHDLEAGAYNYCEATCITWHD